MRVLLIKNNVVENAILADSVERAQTFYPDHEVIEQPDGVGPGFRRVDGAWAPPEPVVVPEDRKITKLAFRKRFTQAERTSMELAALHNNALPVDHPSNILAAGLRASMADQRDALFIDLSDPDTRNGVIALEDGGLLADGRADEILNAPVQPHEKPTGGL